jgi:transposase
MSKARLVLTALLVDRQTPAEAAGRYGVHRAWVYRLKARYEAEGEAAFEPRSRRPRSSPNAVPQRTVDLIVELRRKLSTAGLDAGPATIAWHLEHHHQLRVSVATVSRYLAKAGLVVPEPKKRPKASYIRFAAAGLSVGGPRGVRGPLPAVAAPCRLRSRRRRWSRSSASPSPGRSGP